MWRPKGVNVRRDASLEYISRRRLIRDVVGLMACRRFLSSTNSVRLHSLYGADERSFAPAADDVPKFLLFFIQDHLRRMGVRMEVQLLSNGTVGELVRAERFEAAIGTGPASAEFLAEFFGERSTVGYHNPRVANLIGAAEEGMEEEELDRLYAELSPIFHTDIPATFLYPKVDIYAAHRRVGGMGRDLFMYADRLWLENER